MWQLGQIYTSDVKMSSVSETEQTSRVSALAADLPERLLSCCFHYLFNKFSVVMIFRQYCSYLLFIEWVG